MVYTINGTENYTRRKKIILTGQSSGAQTDFQIKLTALWEAAMQADYDDTRFVKADMQTLIDAWLESKTDSTTADIWAEFPNAPADGVVKTEAYMYYGNAAAASDWDGAATFPEFFDDFEVTGIGDWTTYSGGPDYDSTTQARSPTHSMECSNAGIEGAHTPQTASDNISVDCWVYISSSGSKSFFFGHGDGTDAILLACWGLDIKYYDTAWRDTGINAVTGSWKKLSVYDFDWTAGTFKMSYDGNEASCNVRPSNTADANRITLRMENAVTYYDDVRVRKYATAPPTAAFGTEEHQRRTPMMM